MPDANPSSTPWRMPAEWETHEATWLTWPSETAVWSRRSLKTLEALYLPIIEILTAGENVRLLIPDGEKEAAVRSKIQGAGISLSRVQFYLTQSADIWIRDYGPVFVKNREGKKAWCKWQFNAWGSKYPEYLADNLIFQPGNPWIPFECVDTQKVLEGGSVDVDGAGSGLTTEQCLLNPNREKGRTKESAEAVLRKYLGIADLIWLNRGIAGDDTDGHVDDVARFAGPDIILAAFEKNSADENYSALYENDERLKRYCRERKKILIRLPMPQTAGRRGAKRPASYANFYISNQAVLVPAFNDREDRRAADILKDVFPGRMIFPLNCEELVTGLGTLHCMTQQEPA